VLEPLWNNTYIEQVEILWDETLALEGRAAYYDKAGALKDVIQNHLLQILCIVAMEPPASLAAADLHERKVEVLRSVRIPTHSWIAHRTVRARYGAGTLAGPPAGSGSDVPAYSAEEGVDPARETETYAEIELELDSFRWTGTRFVLRAGKALERRRKGVIVRFRPASFGSFDDSTGAPPANELRIGLDGPETISLHLTGSSPGPPTRLTPLTMTADPPARELPAYSQVLLGALEGDNAQFVHGEEAELSWKIMMPVLQAWNAGLVPLVEYPAGSAGPARLTADNATLPVTEE